MYNNGQEEEKEKVPCDVTVQLLKKPFYVRSCQPDCLDDNIALLLTSASGLAPANNEPDNS